MTIIGRIQRFFDRGGIISGRYENLNVANNVAQLAAIRQNAQVQHATQIRLLSSMLGVPPSPMEDDVLAGGDIKIGSNVGPWVLAAVILVLAAVMLWPLLPKPASAATPAAQGVALPNTGWTASTFDPFAQPPAASTK